jgi:dihydrofolate reductase
MRKLVAHLIITLDWVVGIDAVVDTIKRLRDSKEVEPDFFARIAEEDAMLLGRVTYQQWADYWPNSKVEPFASHINTVPKYVVSKTLQTVPWGTSDNATLLKGDIVQAITGLKQLPGKNIGVHGSPKLVESLIQTDLLDELRLEIYPVIAGSGMRLFHERQATKHLQLANSKITQNGVVILTYKPANTR